MDTDLVLTLGIVVLVLSVPSLLSAWVEGRAPRVGSVMVLLATGMIIAAVTTKPGGYTFNEIPTAMVNVVSRWFN